MSYQHDLAALSTITTKCKNETAVWQTYQNSYIWIFKVNLLCQRSSRSFWKIYYLKYWIGSRILQFVNQSFRKNKPNFVRLQLLHLKSIKFSLNTHKFLAKIYLIFHILKWYSTTMVMLIQVVCPVTTWTHHYGSKLDWYRLVSMVFESIKNLLYWIRIELPCHKISDSTKIIEIRLTTLKNTTT